MAFAFQPMSRKLVPQRVSFSSNSTCPVSRYCQYITPTLGNDFWGGVGIRKSFLKIIFFDHSKYRPLIFQNHFGRMFHFGTSHPSKSLTFNPPKSFHEKQLRSTSPLKSFHEKPQMISGSLHYFLRSSSWHTKSFFRNDFEVPELLLKWFRSGGQWLLKWLQGMGSLCWKNEFKGWVGQTTPQSFQKWFWEGDQSNPQSVGVMSIPYPPPKNEHVLFLQQSWFSVKV